MPIKTELLTLHECCDLLGMSKVSFLTKYERHLSTYVKKENLIFYDKNELMSIFKQMTAIDFLETKLSEGYISLYENLDNSKLNYLGYETLVKEFNIKDFSPALNKTQPIYTP